MTLQEELIGRIEQGFKDGTLEVKLKGEYRAVVRDAGKRFGSIATLKIAGISSGFIDIDPDIGMSINGRRRLYDACNKEVEKQLQEIYDRRAMTILEKLRALCFKVINKKDAA